MVSRSLVQVGFTSNGTSWSPLSSPKWTPGNVVVGRSTPGFLVLTQSISWICPWCLKRVQRSFACPGHAHSACLWCHDPLLPLVCIIGNFVFCRKGERLHVWFHTTNGDLLFCQCFFRVFGVSGVQPRMDHRIGLAVVPRLDLAGAGCDSSVLSSDLDEVWKASEGHSMDMEAQVPVPATIPEEPHKSRRCVLSSDSSSVMVFGLPLFLWKPRSVLWRRKSHDESRQWTGNFPPRMMPLSGTRHLCRGNHERRAAWKALRPVVSCDRAAPLHVGHVRENHRSRAFQEMHAERSTLSNLVVPRELKCRC